MQYAIDTNIVFGIINKADRLNPYSEQLIKCLSGKLVILTSVALELCQRFPEKVYDAIVPVLEFYRSILFKPIPESELEKLEEEKLKELIRTHPRMVNFYKLAFKMARKTRKEHGIESAIFSLMDYYTEVSNCDRLIKILEEKVKELNQKLDVVTFPSMYLDVDVLIDELELIKEKTANIRFKDDSDKRIFCDFVLNFEGATAIFISDDKEFVKKANRALNALKGYLCVEGLVFKRLNEILESC